MTIATPIFRSVDDWTAFKADLRGGRGKHVYHDETERYHAFPDEPVSYPCVWRTYKTETRVMKVSCSEVIEHRFSFDYVFAPDEASAEAPDMQKRYSVLSVSSGSWGSW